MAADKLFASFRDVTDPELQAIVNRAVFRLRSGKVGKGIPELQTLAQRADLTPEQLLVLRQLSGATH